MDCDSIGELLLPYVVGDLQAERKQAVEEHLASCQDCFRACIEADELLDGLRRLRKPASRRSRRARRALNRVGLVPLAVAAGLLLVAFALMARIARGRRAVPREAAVRREDPGPAADVPPLLTQAPLARAEGPPPSPIEPPARELQPKPVAEERKLAVVREPTPPATVEVSFRLTGSEGLLFYRRAGGGWVEAAEGIRLARGDRLDTRAARAVVETEGVTLLFDSGSVATFEPPGSVSLERGEVFARVRACPFAVTAGEAVVEAEGTEFAVRRKGNVTRLMVTEGAVLFGSGGGHVRVEEGFESAAVGEGAPSAPVKTQVWRRLSWTALLDPKLRGTGGEVVLAGERYVEDTWITPDNPGESHSSMVVANLQVVTPDRILVRFDVERIPLGGLRGAFLDLYLEENVAREKDDFEIAAHEVLVPWTVEEVSYTAPWGSAGMKRGHDYARTPLGRARPGGLPARVRLDVTRAVAGWLQGARNNGLVVLASSSARRGGRYRVPFTEDPRGLGPRLVLVYRK